MNIYEGISTAVDYGRRSIGYIEYGVHCLKTGLDAVDHCVGGPTIKPAVYLSALSININKLDNSTQATLTDIKDTLESSFLLIDPKQVEDKNKLIDSVKEKLERMKKDVLDTRQELYSGNETRIHGKLCTTLDQDVSSTERDDFIHSLVHLYQIIRGVEHIIAEGLCTAGSSSINVDTEKRYKDLTQVDSVLARDFESIEKNNRVPNVKVNMAMYD